MLINQVSVFIENESGRLADATAVLDKHGIDIRALSIADTTSFGILRLICNAPDKAMRVLRDDGFTVSQTQVIAVKLDDVPGALNKVLQAVKGMGIDVAYAYAFITHKQDDACVILRVEQYEQAVLLLQQTGFELLPASEIYDL